MKDRIVREIIDGAEESGVLTSGGTDVESTSGNTGIGLAAVCLFTDGACGMLARGFENSIRSRSWSVSGSWPGPSRPSCSPSATATI